MGVVQTAYANGASTKFITEGLGLKVGYLVQLCAILDEFIRLVQLQICTFLPNVFPARDDFWQRNQTDLGGAVKAID